MKEKIEKLFSKQLAKIKDIKLRNKVVEVWVNAAKKGGWKLEELEGICQALGKNPSQETTGNLRHLETSSDNNSTFLTAIGQLDAKYSEIVPKTLNRIGAYIRNHPDEFVQFEAD